MTDQEFVDYLDQVLKSIPATAGDLLTEITALRARVSK